MATMPDWSPVEARLSQLMREPEKASRKRYRDLAELLVGTPLHQPLLFLGEVILGLVMGIPGAFFTWRWPEPFDLLLLILMGVLGTVTQGCYIKGMSIGDAAAMAPIDYIRLVFTVIVGLTLFNEIPSVWTVAGAAIVVVSTLFITWREMQASKAATAAAADTA